MGTSVIVARYYGADIVGVVAIINSFFSVVLVFTLAGTNTSILRLIPEYKTKYSNADAFSLYKKIRTLVIIISILASVVLFFSSNIIADKVFGREDLSILFLIASLIIVFKTLQNFSLQGIRAIEKIKTFALIQLLVPILNFVLLLILTYLYYNEYNPVYVIFLIPILLSFITLFLINKNFNNEISVYEKPEKRTTYKEILNISLPMFLTSSMMIVSAQVAILLLGVFHSEAEVGYYAIAFKIATLTIFILQAINTVIAPKFSSLYSQGKLAELFLVANNATKMIFWAISPLLLVFVLFGKWVIVSLYGAEFEISYYLLMIIIVGMFIGAITGSVGYFLNMCGYEKLLRNITFISVGVTVVLNVILIPVYGVYGAAVTTVISRVFWNVTLTIFIKRKFNMTFLYLPFIRKDINTITK